ncbi:MAG: hypothetical protein JST68_21575 [Bacteroidetes bacterium]|nr:hypothetical protein [Bacteroidota bacterium]
MQYLKITIVTGLLMVLAICFSQCLNSSSGSDPRGDLYAGTDACLKCHQKTSDTYTHSNHYKTSSAARLDSVKALIHSAINNDRFYFGDSSYIQVHDNSQTLFVAGRPAKSETFDIVFGSGEKAQTFGYWKEDTLFQLPLTYLTAQHAWINSPGFPAGRARFNRVIPSRCFECHASFVARESVQTGPMQLQDKLDRASIVYGIDCERCHGPGREHAEHPKEKGMVSIKGLPRQRQMDLCATCHSGNDQATVRTLFAFVPGDTLSHFYEPDFGGVPRNEPDVHGKQVQLLMASVCYQKSGMTCVTCHDPHGAVARNTCMDCHKGVTHTVEVSGSSCMDCHMPLQSSKAIYFNNGSESKNIPYLIRTHKIAIYQ